jgi:hypothetical protein
MAPRKQSQFVNLAAPLLTELQRQIDYLDQHAPNSRAASGRLWQLMRRLTYFRAELVKQLRSEERWILRELSRAYHERDTTDVFKKKRGA